MDSIFKVVLSFIAIIGLTVTGVGLTLACTKETEANTYFDEVSEVIEASNYNADVINDCILEAADNDYVLTVSVYGSTSPGTKKYAEAVMKYNFSVPVLNISIPLEKRKVL